MRFLLLILLLSSCANQKFEGESMVDEALSKKEYSEALDSCHRSLLKDPENPYILIKMASIQRTLGDYVGAEASLLHATTKDTHFVAHKELIRVYLAQKDTGKAQQLLTPLLEEKPNDPDLLTMMGVLKDSQGLYQEALDFFNRAQEAGADRLSTDNNIALTLAKLGHFDEAISHLQHALPQDNSNRTAFNLAAVLTMAGRDEEALNLLKARISPFEAERSLEHIKGQYAAFIQKG